MNDPIVDILFKGRSMPPNPLRRVYLTSWEKVNGYYSKLEVYHGETRKILLEEGPYQKPEGWEYLKEMDKWAANERKANGNQNYPLLDKWQEFRAKQSQFSLF